MPGEYEPKDSRNVTGQSEQGMGAPGGADQQTGGERWGGDARQDRQTAEYRNQMGQNAPADQQAAMEGMSPGQQDQDFSGRQQQGGSAAMGQQHQQQGGSAQSQGLGGRMSATSGSEQGQIELTPDPKISAQAGISSQQQQFDSGSAQMGSGQEGGMATQMGGAGALSASEAASHYSGRLREHMEVIGADGVHVGTVDGLDGHRIKLTRQDSGMGSHRGHHHYLSCGLIAGVEGDKVRLSTTGANAQGMLEEE